MHSVTTWAVAIIVLSFHIWACYRRPRYWYLGGIVPAIWLILLAFLGVHGLIHPAQDWPMLVFPTVILLLLWLKGHETAKKKEIARMKARDLS